MSDKKILTWTRIRAKGEPEFYDPNTDMLKLFPCSADIAIRYLQNVYKEDKKMHDDLDYIFRCFKIFQIRTMEDSMPIDKQFSEYNAAVSKASPEAVNLWRATMFRIQAAIYALMCRRYAAMDKSEVKRLTGSVQAMLLKDVLKPDTYAEVVRQMAEASTSLADQANISVNGLLVCDETADIIDNAKEVVAALLANPEADADWNAVAQACDDEFSTASEELTDQQAICLALAYPSYEHNDLRVTQETDEQRLSTEVDETGE